MKTAWISNSLYIKILDIFKYFKNKLQNILHIINADIIILLLYICNYQGILKCNKYTQSNRNLNLTCCSFIGLKMQHVKKNLMLKKKYQKKNICQQKLS